MGLAASLKRLRENVGRIAPPVISIGVALLLWQVFVQGLSIPRYLLPSPLTILFSLLQNLEVLLANAKVSVVEALGGFLGSIPAGIFLAVLVVWFKPLGRALTPFLVFSQAVPKIAIAPLLLVWFGFGIVSKLLIVSLMAFFPIFLSTLRGLQAVDPGALQMMACMGPSQAQVLWKLRFPNAVPFLLDGLKLAVIRAVMAAIVAEWISSDRGLGHLIIVADATSNAPLLFATIAVLSAVGFSLYVVINGLGWWIAPWYFEMRNVEVQKEDKF